MEAAHPHFVDGSGGREPRMWWKISIDMSRPLVSAAAAQGARSMAGTCTGSACLDSCHPGGGQAGGSAGVLAPPRARRCTLELSHVPHVCLPLLPLAAQVNSEGNLDPFDGLVTYRLLQETGGHPLQGSGSQRIVAPCPPALPSPAC